MAERHLVAIAVRVDPTSPLLFVGGDVAQQTAFTPQGRGTTTISLTQPGGFTAPISRSSVVATVG